MASKTVFILSISSDIGLELAKRYLSDGYTVIGTYRQYGRVGEVANNPKCHVYACDIMSQISVNTFLSWYTQLRLPWETFISSVADPRPLTGFFESDFGEWNESIHINCIEQFRFFHAIWHYRIKKGNHNAVFFAAGGVMKPVVNYSALHSAKIMLIKLCEYIAAENPELNIFAIGPGKTKTKTHDIILKDPKVSKEKYEETMRLMTKEKGTSMEDIYEIIRWLCKAGPTVASGRNFAVVDDPWRGKTRKKLESELGKDPHMYKLRRARSEFLKDVA